MKRMLILCALMLFWAQIVVAGININTADQQTLESLPGIGPAKASAIIEYRTANGKFSSSSELVQVKGIGTKVLGKIEDQVEVE
ncbi:MAG: DNA-binding protein [Desulfobulbaceae bacterium]|nr:MAG: DNA-binding protein [Desulfobulbaceae bacterium]